MAGRTTSGATGRRCRAQPPSSCAQGQRGVRRGDRGHRDVDDLAATAGQGLGDGERGVQTGQRVGDRVAAEHRAVGTCAHQAARHRGVVAERRPVVRCSPSAPWPVMRTQTRPSRAATSSGPRPRWRSAAGRDDSMTTSATSSSAAQPRRVVEMLRRSRAFRRSSSRRRRVDPARVPSGRAAVSTFTTVAPARASSCPHSGPAHIDDRSTTSSPARVPRRCGGPTRRTTGAAAAASPSTAAGRPSNRARSTTSAAARPSRPRPRWRATDLLHAQPISTRAGTASTSSGRDSVSAHQPSRAASSRVAPPADTRPRRDSPSSAARPASSSAASTVTPMRRWSSSAVDRACDEDGGAGEVRRARRQAGQVRESARAPIPLRRVHADHCRPSLRTAGR